MKKKKSIYIYIRKEMRERKTKQKKRNKKEEVISKVEFCNMCRVRNISIRYLT